MIRHEEEVCKVYIPVILEYCLVQVEVSENKDKTNPVTRSR